MKVNSPASPSVQTTQTDQTQKAQQSAKTEKLQQIEKAKQQYTGNVASSSNAEISARAKNSAKAHAVAAATPDVREDKVAELKRKIAEGSYKIDSDEIADKMIREHSAL